MFEQWRDSDEYPTLFRLHREVRVDMVSLLPASGFRQDELPLWVKSCGLRLEPWMPARQVAWVRRSDGGWLAVVEMPAGSANGHSHVNMQLWLPPQAVTTDLTTGQGRLHRAAEGQLNE